MASVIAGPLVAVDASVALAYLLPLGRDTGITVVNCMHETSEADPGYSCLIFYASRPLVEILR